MRARYYNVDIKRFINQDVLTGSILKSQSLNRYSYVQGNPVKLTDPFGLSPDISWKGFVHGALDLLGLIPGIGDVCDVVNAVLYAIEGNTREAFSSLVSSLPFLGSAVGGVVKWGGRYTKTATKIAGAIEYTTRVASNTATLARGAYGTYVTGKKIYTDIKDGKGVSLLDIGTIALNGATVAMAGKNLAKDFGLGSRPKQAKAKPASEEINGACFVAGTLISTEEGLRPIEEIQVGDYVWSENPETNEKGLKQVVNTFIHNKDEILHLIVNGEEIKTTREHPFYVEGKGFVKAEYLELGDVLRLQTGENVLLEDMRFEKLDEPIYVYNFEVEDYHTYYVGESSVLVHNKAMLSSEAKLRRSKGGSQAADFYVAPNGKTLPGQYKDWLGTNMRDSIMDSVSDPTLKRAIGEVYRPGSIIGDGGTADIIRFEQETGILLSKSGHIQKGIDMLKYFQKLIDSGNLSPSDTQVAQEIVNGLQSALGGK